MLQLDGLGIHIQTVIQLYSPNSYEVYSLYIPYTVYDVLHILDESRYTVMKSRFFFSEFMFILGG